MALCDQLADQIAGQGMADVPKFKPMWSESKRASALPELIAWLSDDSLDWRKYMKSNAWAFFAERE